MKADEDATLSRQSEELVRDVRVGYPTAKAGRNDLYAREMSLDGAASALLLEPDHDIETKSGF